MVPMKVSSARRRGSALAWRRSLRRSSRSRSTSAAGKVGRRTSSARSARASGSRSAGTSTPAENASQPASACSGGAQPLGRLDQRDRVVVLGPLRECPGGEHRRAGIDGRLVGGTAREDQRRGDQRPAGQVGDEDPQAVVEAMVGDRREVIRSGRAGDGSVGDDGPIPRVRRRSAVRAHAATSSVSSAASSSARAASSAAGPSGR